MFQVYFLSVLTNVLVGLFLVFEKKLDSYSYFTEKKNMISIILGFGAFIIGIAKFFVVAQPDIIFFGDFLPALLGVCGGLSLLLNYYLESGKNQFTINPVVYKIFVDGKKIIGFFCLLFGFLHFILPQVRVL